MTQNKVMDDTDSIWEDFRTILLFLRAGDESAAAMEAWAEEQRGCSSPLCTAKPPERAIKPAGGTLTPNSPLLPHRELALEFLIAKCTQSLILCLPIVQHCKS